MVKTLSTLYTKDEEELLLQRPAREIDDEGEKMRHPKVLEDENESERSIVETSENSRKLNAGPKADEVICATTGVGQEKMAPPASEQIGMGSSASLVISEQDNLITPAKRNPRHQSTIMGIGEHQTCKSGINTGRSCSSSLSPFTLQSRPLFLRSARNGKEDSRFCSSLALGQQYDSAKSSCYDALSEALRIYDGSSSEAFLGRSLRARD